MKKKRDNFQIYLSVMGIAFSLLGLATSLMGMAAFLIGEWGAMIQGIWLIGICMFGSTICLITKRLYR